MSVSVFIDESGTHDDANVIVLAGYILSSDQSQKFSREWKINLLEKNLPFAHMTDLATGNGHYKNMEMIERIQQGKLLIDLIRRRTRFGFSVAIDKNFYEKEIEIIEGMPTAYTFCVMSCLMLVKDWISAHSATEKITYIFENGHKHSSEVKSVLYNIAKQPNLCRIFRYFDHSFAMKQDAIPLQAADMLAWQVYHFHKRCSEGFTTPRKDYLALIRPVDKCYLHNANDLYRFKDEAIKIGLI